MAFKDSIRVLTEKNGTETIEGLVLNRHMYPANTPSVNPNETILETNAFARKCKLRLLHLSNVQLNGCYKELPTKLRWLCWHAFPLDCIPTDFPVANLAVLEMHDSSLTQIWKGTKGLHEGGIFSTFLCGNEVPGLFSHKSTESSISFVVPLVPNVKIRGLNIFVVYENLVSEIPYGVNYSDYDALIPIVIKVRNRTKALEWIYCPSFYGIPPEGEEMVWLSHWKLENQLEGGDEVTVTVFLLPWRQVKQCGIHVVHEKEESMSLCRIRDPCYPYVIGGDLSGSEVMPGTYFLSSLAKPLIYKPQLHEFIGDSDTEKEEPEDELMLAPTGGSSNCDFRGWKGLIIAAGFFLSLSLFARFPLPRRKKHSA